MVVLARQLHHLLQNNNVGCACERCSTGILIQGMSRSAVVGVVVGGYKKGDFLPFSPPLPSSALFSNCIFFFFFNLISLTLYAETALLLALKIAPLFRFNALFTFLFFRFLIVGPCRKGLQTSTNRKVYIYPQ